MTVDIGSPQTTTRVPPHNIEAEESVLGAAMLSQDAANLALVTGARKWGLEDGLIYVFIVMTVAAAEAAVGLALVITVFRKTRSLNVDDLNTLSG